MMKKIQLFSALLGFCMLGSAFVGCGSTETAKAEELSYVSMRINPEIELVVDNGGEVVAANAINEDGETVLSELDLSEMTVEEAGEAFTDVATELGFIDVAAEDATVYILAESNDEEFAQDLEKRLTEKINGYFDKKGIFGKVAPEALDEFKTLAEEWGVSLKDARMIQRILELYPEMTAEEILALTMRERIDLIKDDHVKNGLPANLRGEYKLAVDALMEEYAELFTLQAEWKELARQLRDEELTDDARALLQEQLDALKTEIDTLRAEYEAAVAALKAEKREQVDEIKNEIKQQAQERREEFEGRLREHEEALLENAEAIEIAIRDWREHHR